MQHITLDIREQSSSGFRTHAACSALALSSTEEKIKAMSTTRDFVAAPLGEMDGDVTPPAYGAAHFGPPAYEPPPTYKASVCDRDDYIVLRSRFYLNTRDVQLSPLEVALLKDGFRLPITVSVHRPNKQGKGVRATLKWVLHRYLVYDRIVVRKEDVDDYGRWRDWDRH